MIQILGDRCFLNFYQKLEVFLPLTSTRGQARFKAAASDEGRTDFIGLIPHLSEASLF